MRCRVSVRLFLWIKTRRRSLFLGSWCYEQFCFVWLKYLFVNIVSLFELVHFFLEDVLLQWIKSTFFHFRLFLKQVWTCTPWTANELDFFLFAKCQRVITQNFRKHFFAWTDILFRIWDVLLIFFVTKLIFQDLYHSLWIIVHITFLFQRLLQFFILELLNLH